MDGALFYFSVAYIYSIIFCLLEHFVYFCSKLLEVFKTKARYNWGMRSSNAFEKALKHYDFH